jgi:hypothetical protein
MCRSIKVLRNSSNQAADTEVRLAALQFVRKISGYRSPSQANSVAFEAAVDEIAAASRNLIISLRQRV